MVQNVNYEIPYQKKQVQKTQQQLGELEHKEAEIKRNAALSATNYDQASQELGLQVLLFCQCLLLSASLDAPLEAKSHALKKTPVFTLTNLRNIREKPPSLNVYVTQSLNVIAQGCHDELAGETISQIDWDIGTVEETEDTGNGLGPYEILNGSDILEDSPKDGVEFHQVMSNPENSDAPYASMSESPWDIFVENPQVDGTEEADLSRTVSIPGSNLLSDSSEALDTNHSRSQAVGNRIPE
ncbi:unnamed protein product [Fraxinus pennsylvanica]|uniref:Uncharacterized protein n=1 Tax=Fraxinus pennsylvanica TaxID=56036 RepID=A0AAD2A0P1_9LAMI|nr:unnamed protein product [Fraxinus pennsylvanica]